MSVIAYDGTFLAADKQVSNADLAVKCTKIKRLKSGEVAAFTGDIEHGLMLFDWYENGAKVEDWPKFQAGDDWTRLIVAGDYGAKFYEKQPIAQPVEDAFAAWGSGRDFAMGAMEMGADASQAVAVACKFNVFCGLGCDTFFVNAQLIPVE